MNKTKIIREVFNKIPSYYDIMNDAMSIGIHRIWKKQLVAKVDMINNGNYLDLATGSGDIATLLLEKNKFFNIDLTCADPDADMLNKAREKIINKGFIKKISFIKTEAENMPFEKDNFDIITLSFGLRNFSNIEQGLSEIFRTLKPRGTLYCLEFSPKVKHQIIQKAYNVYLNILPKIGKIMAKDQESYEYLAQSIKDFKKTEQIIDIMLNIGFDNVNVEALSGGICNIFTGQKNVH